MTVKIATVKNLMLKKKSQIDGDNHYSDGFAKACSDHNVDPLKLIDLINTLEIHL